MPTLDPSARRAQRARTTCGHPARWSLRTLSEMDALALGLGLAVALLFVKEVGVPLPVPGDLVVLGTGAAVSRSDGVATLAPLLALAVIVGATIVGGAIQFLIVRGAGRPVVLRVLRRIGI